jgi:hypothetical protein
MVPSGSSQVRLQGWSRGAEQHPSPDGESFKVLNAHRARFTHFLL